MTHRRQITMDMLRTNATAAVLYQLEPLLSNAAQSGPDELTDDLLQEGRLAVLAAIEEFKGTSAGQFVSLASTRVRAAVADYLNNNSAIRVPSTMRWRYNRDELESDLAAAVRAVDEAVPFDTFIEEGGVDMFGVEDYSGPLRLANVAPGAQDEVGNSAVVNSMLRDALKTLPPRERLVVCMVFGFDGHPPMSRNEIARELECSQPNVSQLKKRGLEKLRTQLEELEWLT